MKRKGQSIVEYFIVTIAILLVVLSSGFIDRVRDGFKVYFDSAVQTIRGEDVKANS